MHPFLSVKLACGDEDMGTEMSAVDDAQQHRELLWTRALGILKCKLHSLLHETLLNSAATAGKFQRDPKWGMWKKKIKS